MKDIPKEVMTLDKTLTAFVLFAASFGTGLALEIFFGFTVISTYFLFAGLLIWMSLFFISAGEANQ